MSVNWVACSTCYTKTEGTELMVLDCSVPVIFFGVDEGGGGGLEGGAVDHLRGHPDVMPAIALWLTRLIIL